MRRRFLILMGSSLTLILVSIFGFNDMISLFLRKIRHRMHKDPDVAPFSQRPLSNSNYGAGDVSLEKVLNSRCTSDFDGDSTLNHWGLFDHHHRLSNDILASIVEMANSMPIIGNELSKVRLNENILSFISNKTVSEKKYRISMIYSGMQQQAIGLICTAYGIGYKFRGMGPNGTISEDKSQTNVTMRLEPASPSYEGSYWSVSPPSNKEKPWYKGNLPDPNRDSKSSFLGVFNKIAFHSNGGREIASLKELSQLLWAGRGRTPHYYLSKPWGLTIPVYQGEQNHCSLRVVTESGDYAYQNWNHRRPTHSLKRITASQDRYRKLRDKHPSFNSCIVVSRYEDKARALWEAGFQVLNIVLQATSMDLDFEVFLDDDLSYMNSVNDEFGTATIAVGLKSNTEVVLPT